jgi:glycine cleavage system aminomethyltransferase T
MAMLRAGRTQLGKEVTVHDAGQIVTTARVVAPMFYDPSGVRMNG